MRNRLIYISLLLFSLSAKAQIMCSYIRATSGKERLESFRKIKKMRDTSLFKSVEFKNIGPFKVGGRVTDLAVKPEKPNYFYVATAAGGIFRTEDNGKNYTPLFQNQASLSIGDIFVDWENNETLWVGTGEANSSRSSYPGTGIYVSRNKGISWKHKGLENTNHIARVIVHPNNPNIIWVAAMGSLYSKNKERGVYKSVNGGDSWKKVLYIDEFTGAIDLVINPQNPDILYAAMWHRQTRAWNRIEAGETSGIYKTTDGGTNWQHISDKKHKFPQGEGIGRIGLALAPQNPDIVYAFLDNQTPLPQIKTNLDKSNDLTITDFKNMSKEEFLQLPEKKIDYFLKKTDYPINLSVEELKQQVRENKFNFKNFYYYKTDTNIVKDPQITGIQIYKSTHGGKKWKLMNKKMPYSEDFNYNFGYYFGQIVVSPADENRLYFGGLYLYTSKNGGKKINVIKDRKVHVDHHALWINPNNENHLIIGNDGGINISYNKGKSWTLANNFAITQFYAVNYDNLEPYNIYGGTQDNGTWFTDISNFKYQQLGGGDGMQIEIDTLDYRNIIFGYQYGMYFISEFNKKKPLNFSRPEKITHSHKIHEKKPRFGWQSPIFLSPQNKTILYMGSEKLLKFDIENETSESISPDLTGGGQKGCTPFGTIFSFSFSKLQKGLIYTGSDDGAVFVTKDSSKTWQKINHSLPRKLKVTDMVASAHKKERVYTCLSGYSFDNFEKFLYRSENYGKTWNEIGKNLPDVSVNCIAEDPKHENLIFIGTDYGVFVSVNKGESFYTLHNKLPNVAVLDIKINPNTNHLIVATHGRSLFLLKLDELYSKIKN